MRPMSKKQLAASYGVSVKTLNSWLRPHLQTLGINSDKFRRMRVFTPKQLQKIFDIIGRP